MEAFLACDGDGLSQPTYDNGKKISGLLVMCLTFGLGSRYRCPHPYLVYPPIPDVVSRVLGAVAGCVEGGICPGFSRCYCGWALGFAVSLVFDDEDGGGAAFCYLAADAA